MINLYYFHDPMCSWCYAFDRTLKHIESNLPSSISLIKILGGLAPDSIEPMPESLKSIIQANWRKIEQTVPHIQFNYDFWDKNQPIRSTYPSCRAVLAAKKQSPVFENKMILQIQTSYYKNAENPSLDVTLYNCAKQIGLNGELFRSDLSSQEIDNELRQQIEFARELGVTSYPSLGMEINNQFFQIKIDYNNEQRMLNQIIKFTTLRRK